MKQSLSITVVYDAAGWSQVGYSYTELSNAGCPAARPELCPIRAPHGAFDLATVMKQSLSITVVYGAAGWSQVGYSYTELCNVGCPAARPESHPIRAPHGASDLATVMQQSVSITPDYEAGVKSDTAIQNSVMQVAQQQGQSPAQSEPLMVLLTWLQSQNKLFHRS